MPSTAADSRVARLTDDRQFLTEKYNAKSSVEKDETTLKEFVSKGYAPSSVRGLDGSKLDRWALVSGDAPLAYVASYKVPVYMKRGSEEQAEESIMHVIFDELPTSEDPEQEHLRELLRRLPSVLGESASRTDEAGSTLPAVGSVFLTPDLDLSKLAKIGSGWEKPTRLNQVLTLNSSAFKATSKGDPSLEQPISRDDLSHMAAGLSAMARRSLENTDLAGNETAVIPDPENLTSMVDRRFALLPDNVEGARPPHDSVCGLSLAPQGTNKLAHPFAIVEAYNEADVITLTHMVDATNISDVLEGITRDHDSPRTVILYGNQSPELASAWKACGGKIEEGGTQNTVAHLTSFPEDMGTVIVKGLGAWSTHL